MYQYHFKRWMILLEFILVSCQDDIPIFELPDRAARQCAQENNVALVNALGIEDGKFEQIDENVENFVLCYFRRTGVFNQTDEFQKNMAEHTFRFYVGSAQIHARVCQCQCEEGDSPAKTAFKILMCLHKNNDDTGNVIFNNRHHSIF